jgi:hypothetical protein
MRSTPARAVASTLRRLLPSSSQFATGTSGGSTYSGAVRAESGGGGGAHSRVERSTPSRSSILLTHDESSCTGRSARELPSLGSSSALKPPPLEGDWSNAEAAVVAS